MDKDVVGFFKNASEYIALSSEVINDQLQKIDSLEKEVQTQKLTMQKAATDVKPVFSREQLAGTVTKMVDAKLFKQAEAGVVVDRVLSNPSLLLKFLEKIAEDTMTQRPVRSMGQCIPTVERKDSARSSDKFYEERFGK